MIVTDRVCSVKNANQRNRFSDGLIDLSFGLLLAFCCLVSEAPISGHLSMALFCLYVFILIRNKTLFLLKYLAIIMFVGMNIFGCYVTEYSSLFLFELSVTSSFAGSLPLLVFSRWLLLPVISFADSFMNIEVDGFQHISSSKSKWIDAFSAIFLVLVIVCFSRVALHPAFLLGIDRFEFANTVTSGGIASIISGYLNELSIIPMLSTRHGNKRLGITCLVLYILYLFWIGTQFGAYFTLVSMLILAFFDKLQAVPKNQIRRIAYISLTLIVAMVFVAVGMRSITSNSSLQSVDYLLQRTAQQGQLWWRTYDMEKDGAVGHQLFSDEIEQQIGASTSVSDNVGSTFGIYGVMYRTAPTDRVSLQLSKGSAYAEAGYAAAYYYFGPLGAIGFSIVIGVLVSLITNGLLSALMFGRIIEAVIYSRLLVLARGFMGTFIFTGLLSPLSIACYIYLMGAYAVRLNGIERKRVSKGIRYAGSQKKTV